MNLLTVPSHVDVEVHDDRAVDLARAYEESAINRENQTKLNAILSYSTQTGVDTVNYPSYATNIFWQVS